MNSEQETAMYDQPDDVEHIDVSEDDLHAEVDTWLENVPADRCTGAYLAERFAQWQASRKVEVTTDEREALIERVLKVTDDMRSGGWHSGKTVAEMGQKIYDILTESTNGYVT